MSSTRAAWNPRSAKTRMPASSSLRIVLRPCARSSRVCAGFGGGVYASLMLPETVTEAARRFADRTAYIAPGGWSLTYADIGRVAGEVAAGLAARGVRARDVVALILPPGPEYLFAYCAISRLGA